MYFDLFINKMVYISVEWNSFWEKLEIVGNLLPRQFIKITL